MGGEKATQEDSADDSLQEPGSRTMLHVKHEEKMPSHSQNSLMFLLVEYKSISFNFVTPSS